MGEQAESGSALLEVDHLSVSYRPTRGGPAVQAVSDVSLGIRRGETVGLVGESGCGKSSLAHAVVQLPPPSAGRVVLDGLELTKLKGKSLRAIRPSIQLILQDPISSLNPKRSVADIVAEPAKAWGLARGKALDQMVDQSLESVGLDPARTRHRRPYEFSGGQCQRVCIARALILDPKVIVCDEPVSALDVSVQAQILNLLEDLRASRDLTMLFISHDLAVVKNVSDRIVVMYLGKVCEISPAEKLYRSPAHPYTAALLESIPSPDMGRSRTRRALVGDLPSSANPPSGCRFRTRCPMAQEICATTEPPLVETLPGQFVACHFPLLAEPSAVSVGDAARSNGTT
jgi:peptide/nickel transport system ATP-binding protein